MPYNYQSLNPEKALIWRIVHCDNLPWILDNGLHCGNGGQKSPAWVSIGSDELITKRATTPALPDIGFIGYSMFYRCIKS